MPFSDAEIERIKRNTDLAALVRESGVELKPAGKELVGCCPFHNDRTPSLSLSPANGFWKCFGCNAGGTVIDWVMKRDGVSFREAVETLQHNGHHKDGSSFSSAAAPQKKNGKFDITAAEVQNVLKWVVLQYSENLFRTQRALQYLAERGIKNRESLETLHVGYGDGSLLKRLPPGKTVAGKRTRHLLEQIGILNERGRERFCECIVIPAHDGAGNITQLQGRRISESDKKTRHLLLPQPTCGLFNQAALESNEIILCEAPLDMLSLYTNGYPNALSLFGCNGYSTEVHAVLVESGIRRVQIAFDADEAGNAAAEQITEKLLESGIECFRVEFPPETDANDFVCQSKNPREEIRTLLTQAVRYETKKGSEQIDENRDTENSSPDFESFRQKTDIPAEISANDDIVELITGDRYYRVEGFKKNMSPGNISASLTALCGDRSYTDRLEFHSGRERERFVKNAATEFELEPRIVKSDVERVFSKLREIQSERIRVRDDEQAKKVYVLSEREQEEALEFLRAPDLVERLVAHFQRCGMVGERMNLLCGYIAATSRLLDMPLHILFQSSSAAGKTTMMKAILAMMPDESVYLYTALTRQALYYMQGRDLRHVIIAVEEDVGAEYARHIIKMLKTEGRASIASTMKDQQTGRMETGDFSIEGPMSFATTSTALWIDDEELNRDLILASDETREQTAQILKMQRFMRTLAGREMREERDKIRQLHKNAQRLLRPYLVLNPYAEQMTFLDARQRLRRDHEKYLGIIEAVTLLFQYQRPVKTRRRSNGEAEEYIETTVDDIRLANELACAILGRSLDDCPPHTRIFLERASELADAEAKARSVERKDVRLRARQLSECTGLSMAMVSRHLSKLFELEYVLPHSTKGGRLVEYEVLYRGEGRDGMPFLPGLIDPSQLK